MVEITSWTEFKTHEVLSKTYETRILKNLEIRDTSVHKSCVIDSRIYNLVTFFVVNGLNQSVTVQVKGNRVNGTCTLTLTNVEGEFDEAETIEGETSKCSAYIIPVSPLELNNEEFDIRNVESWPFIASEIITGKSSKAKGNFSSVTDFLAYSGALDIGSSFTVATSDSGAKAIAALTDGVLPYMFVECSCTAAPGSGNLSCYVEKKYIE